MINQPTRCYLEALCALPYYFRIRLTGTKRTQKLTAFIFLPVAFNAVSEFFYTDNLLEIKKHPKFLPTILISKITTFVENCDLSAYDVD